MFSVFNIAVPSGITGDGHLFVSGFSKTLDEAKKTLDETKTTLEGLSRFFKTVSRAINTITGIIGFRAIILLIFIMLASNVLSFIAIPKGKVSFLISLILVNILWITWEQSFSPGSTGYMANIAKTNLTLIIPVASLMILSRLFTRLRGKFSGISLLSFNWRKKGTYTEDDLMQIVEQFQKESLDLQQSLITDVRNGPKKGIRISHKTNEALTSIGRTLKSIKKDKV